MVWWSLALGLCLLLATRPIGVTHDDGNYLRYFEPVSQSFNSWWHYLLEEPGWNLITVALSPLGPEPAYRVVLFVSPLAFILGANRIAGGRWLAVGWWSWLILTAIILDRAGVGLYVGAIRQGFATSVFLLLVATRVPAVAAAALAGTVHSAFLIVAAMVFLTEALGDDRRRVVLAIAGIGLYAALLALDLAPSPFAGADLGRRSGAYDGATGLNLTGYTALAVWIGGTLWLARDARSPWHVGSLVFLASGVALSLAHGGFVRIFLSLGAFVLMALTQTPPRRRLLAIGFYFALSVAMTLWADRDATAAQDSWLGLWSLVVQR